MSPPKPTTSSPLLAFLLLLLLSTRAAAQSCDTYCTDYANNLQSCASQFGTSVQGSGADITADAVECVCVGTGSVSAFYELGQCYECNVLTGDDLALTELWIITCATGVEESVDDAVNCWNTQLLQGNDGPPCYQPPASSTIGAGGGGGGGSGPTPTPTPMSSEGGGSLPTSTLGGSEDTTTDTAVLGGAPTSTDTAFGSPSDTGVESTAAATSSSEGLTESVAAPTSTPSSLVTSAKHSSVPAFSSNPAFSQASSAAGGAGGASSVQQQPPPTETTNPNTTPTPTNSSSLGDRVQVSGVAFLVGLLAVVVFL